MNQPANQSEPSGSGEGYDQQRNRSDQRPGRFPGVIVFWRHGRTSWNANGRLQGQSDIELDDIGQKQTAEAAKILAKSFPGAAIVSSDLKRASQTTAELAKLTGQTPIFDPRIRERSFGEWEGLGRDEISERWPEIFSAWQRGSDAVGKPPGGESRSEVGKRVADAVREHVVNLSGYPAVIIVSHGAAITAGITALLGEDPAAWHGITGLDNANWSVLVNKSHGGVVRDKHFATDETEPAVAPHKLWRLVGHNLGANLLDAAEVFGA